MRAAVFIALLTASSLALSQKVPTKHHVITDGEITVIKDCHRIALDAEDALDQARQDAADGRATLERPKHSIAYDCYTAEKPAYDTLSDLYFKDKLNDQGKKFMNIIRDDMAYFQLSLTADEK
jgi:hypothetical protein